MWWPAAADGQFLAQQTGIPWTRELVRAVAGASGPWPSSSGGLEKRQGKQVLSDLTSELFRTAAFPLPPGAAGGGTVRPPAPPGD